MGFKSYLQKASFAWRNKYYVERLEENIEEFPEGYEDEKNRFFEDLRGYTTTNAVYFMITLTFYASIVTSVTAALGFKVYVFEKVYSILGFSTVGVLYFITRYVRRLALVDLQNSRTRIISYLTMVELGEDKVLEI